MKKQTLIVSYDIPALIDAMCQEVDAWAAYKNAERRYRAAVDAWCNAMGDEVAAAAKKRDEAHERYVIKSERYGAIGDVITALCEAVNVDYKALYAVAKAFSRRNERDFFQRGTRAEWRMTTQNEESFRRLVAGKKTEWMY